MNPSLKIINLNRINRQLGLKNNTVLIMILFSITISLVYLFMPGFTTQEYTEDYYIHSMKDRSYNLKKPKDRWDLPNKLEEVSGLSYYKKNQLACIQDEDGDLFIYNLKKREIIRTEKFGKKGDYEGVEIVSDTAYVLKSNGNLYYFRLTNHGIGEINEINTDLSSKNDSEGLGYLTIKSELLVACKEDPGTKKIDIEKSRSIFRVDLPEKNFKKKPRFIIDGKSYSAMLEKKELSKKKHKPFKPSGVAVHPQTGYTYIIGSVGKMMVVLNREGKIDDLIPLHPEIFWQPEGICFSPEGDLYISSEGRGRKGYILKF